MAQDLLPHIPSQSIDAVITDPMYGVAPLQSKTIYYDWGGDPFNGSAKKWWEYHDKPIYREWQRIIKPDGAFCFAMGCKFAPDFPEWFGGEDNYKTWNFTRYLHRGVGQLWVFQRFGTDDPKRNRFPNRNGNLVLPKKPKWRSAHPCPKPYVEMEWLVEEITKPGQVILDCFCGVGTTLAAAKKLGRHYIGCDRSAEYVKLAKWDLSRHSGNNGLTED
jgi:DNA modification methylase